MPSTTSQAGGGGDTNQEYCYGESGSIPCPSEGEAFFGQDGNYRYNNPSFVDNGDGTVTDQTTGLMWQQVPGDKMTWNDAMANAANVTLGGHTDWRVPTIKELYSLMDFSGITRMEVENAVPYIDTDYFVFEYGDESAGERMIDAQYWSSTTYTGSTMSGRETAFGVNFADGRIKGYPKSISNAGANQGGRFVRYVRGPVGYGENEFVNNGDGTITDHSSGLTWLQDDSGAFGAGGLGDGTLSWPEALAFCENLDVAGQTDWRLPDAKELQYIVDYTRSPSATGSAAIDPLFNTTAITDENGNTNYPYFWTSTTHLDGMPEGSNAAYIAFGEALGEMNGQIIDVHGAGAQRSDPKANPRSDFPYAFGPQGDINRGYNFARCVRGGAVQIVTGGETDPRLGSGGGQPPQNGQGQQNQGQPPQDSQGQNGNGQPPQQGGQGGPPQAALAACSGLSQGNACSFNANQGRTISGTCNPTPDGTLACMPQGGPGNGGPGGGQ
jgi:hypothetical protein